MSKHIINRLEEYDANWIILQFPTLIGEIKEIHVSRNHFDESVFEKGYLVEGLSKYFSDRKDLYLVPRAETYAEVPWYVRAVRFISTIRESSGVRYPYDVYYPLEKSLAVAKKVGLNLEIKPAVEFTIVEGFTVDRVTRERGPSAAFDSKEGKWNPMAMLPSERPFSSFPYDAYYGVRQQIVDILTQAFGYGVVYTTHGEATSQQRIGLEPMDPVKSAEAVFSLKYVAKAASIANNVSITFMPLLFPGEKGNALELRLSGNLIEDGQLTQEGEYFIGGILEHYKTLLLFTNPTTNSYKRLMVEPFYRSWGYGIDGTLVKVELRENEGYLSLGFPDAISNPFLAYAAIIAAGSDGVKQKISPGDPVKISPRTMTMGERKKRKIHEMPRDLLQVIEGLESDNNYLKGIFPPEMVIEYAEHKYKELRDNLSSPSAYELDKYFYL